MALLKLCSRGGSALVLRWGRSGCLGTLLMMSRNMGVLRLLLWLKMRRGWLMVWLSLLS